MKINLHCLSFWSFIQKFEPIIEVKQLKVGGKSHCEINAFSSSCWPQLLQRPFPNSSEFSLIIPDEFGEHLISDQRPFLHTESLQILQNTSSMLLLLLFSSPHSFSTGFRSEDWDSHSKSFILCSVTHYLCWFWCLFWIIVLMEDPTMDHYKISNKGSQA